MKRLTFNLFNKHIAHEVDTPLEVNLQEFWSYYLQLLQIKTGYFLTNTEVRFLSLLLSKDPKVSWMKPPYSTKFREELGMSYQFFHNTKRDLAVKGMLVSDDDHLKRGKDYTIQSNLRQFQSQLSKYLTDGQEIEFKYPFIINNS